MSIARRIYRGLVVRLPPRAAWAVWRLSVRAAAIRGGEVPPTRVALAEVIWGAGEDELRTLVERRLAGGDLSPELLLIVSDCDAVHVAAVLGCRFEHVPPRADWERRRAAGDYDAFVTARIASIRASYAIERFVD